MAAIHGQHEFRCKVCVVRAQLEYAKQMTARVEALEHELAELELALPLVAVDPVAPHSTS